MRVFLSIIVGLVGGFILGIALSSFIGIISITLFKVPMGIKYLPYYTAILCAIILPMYELKLKTQ
ncbi:MULTISPECIES: DUF5957 family protein [Ureibacillus]|jgi:Na+/H+ antiporter NhaA|uniref:DUF5957 family protein n=1 Tax=Ureibacillus TaxID=160795 RepID=UPI000BBBF04E|nr:DUF5957 family protein [Ureibacillus thermosphaericus]